MSPLDAFDEQFAETDRQWQALIARMDAGPLRDACEREREAWLALKAALDGFREIVTRWKELS